MERSVSPLHVHVGRKTPVHVHLKSKRPSLRASTSGYNKMRSSHWGSSSRTPWVPPPAKSTSNNRMSWEGPTHRLEITPGVNGEVGESTVLRLSDLSDPGQGSTNIVVEREGSDQPIKEKLHSLRAEVDQLKTEVDLERSLRDLEDTENALRESSMSLREREAELAMCKEELMDKEIENVRLSRDKVKGHHRSSSESAESRQREKLCKKMLEMEMDSTSLCKQADSFRAAIRKLQKDRRFLSVYASDVAEQKDILLEQLAEFQCSNKTLRKMLRAQQAQESSIGKLADQRDVLVQHVSEADATNNLLRSRLDESEKLALHTQSLHDEVGQRDGEIQGLNIRIQSLEEQLRAKNLDCVQLESSLTELKHRSQFDKDLLKKATRQHKERAVESEQTVETLGTQLELANAELDELRGKLSKSTREEITHHSEIRSLHSKVKELHETLDLSKVTSKSSVNAVSARLTEKTQELNSAQMENDRLQTAVSTLEGRIRAMETTARAKKTSLESEIAQLQSSVKQYEALTQEYKGQVEGGRLDFEEKSRELRYKDGEVERARQEGAIEIEKTKIIYQQQVSELESTKDLLKATESRLKDTEDRLLSYEQCTADQMRLVAELNAKLDQTNSTMDSVRDKWHESAGENRSLMARLEVQERRLQDTEQQNRELMEIAGKREDAIQKLQGRVEELVREVSSITSKHEMAKSDYRRQAEQNKNRADNKDRANLSRIADLETQLSRANSVATQLRKSKEDGERRYQSKIHDYQDRLEQANSSKRSMENYANFLKTSYASVFNDTSGTPGSPLSPLIH